MITTDSPLWTGTTITLPSVVLVHRLTVEDGGSTGELVLLSSVCTRHLPVPGKLINAS